MTTLTTAKPDKMEELREKALKEAEKESEKERWGLFQQPPPLKIGECDYVPHHFPRDEKDLPLSGPRNFYTGPPLKGKTQDVYFEPSNFLNKDLHKDPYFDYTKIHKPMKQKIMKITLDKDGIPIKPEPFVPAVTKWNEYKDASQTHRLGVPYGNKPDAPIKKIVCKKDSDGRVTIGPPNMLHYPLRPGHYNSTIGHTINAFPKHSTEPYDVNRHNEYIKQKKWQDFYRNERGGNFRSMSAGPYTLNKDQAVFGNRPPLGKTKKVWKYKGVKHDDNFVPSNPNKSGKIEGTFDKFTRLIPNPAGIHKAKYRPVEPRTKDAFYPSRNFLTKPSPSISLNFMNIRSAIR